MKVYLIVYVDGYYPDCTLDVCLTLEAASKARERHARKHMEEWDHIETLDEAYKDIQISEWESVDE